MSSARRTRERMAKRRELKANPPARRKDHREAMFDLWLWTSKAPEVALCRRKRAEGDRDALALKSKDAFVRWWQMLMILEQDPEALEAYDVGVREKLGAHPLEVGAIDWPEALTEPELGTGQVQAEESSPVTGWRMWALDGSTLLAPFQGRDERRGPHGAGVRWTAGVNHARSNHCWDSKRRPVHPSPAAGCYCGIRAVQSLTILSRFNAAMRGNADAAMVVAEVDLWGSVTGPAVGDDWPFTIRGQHARLSGSIHLAGSQADVAEALADRYGVRVEVDSDVIRYVER